MRFSVLNRARSVKQNTDENSLPRGYTSFAALVKVPLILTFKLRPLTLSYSPIIIVGLCFTQSNYFPDMPIQVYILIWVPQLLTTTSMREQQQLYSLWIGLSVHVIR